MMRTLRVAHHLNVTCTEWHSCLLRRYIMHQGSLLYSLEKKIFVHLLNYNIL